MFATLLKLSEMDLEDIDTDEKTIQDKRYRTLQKWKAKYSFEATYRVLVDVFLKLGRADLAEEVCKLDKGTYKLVEPLMTVVLRQIKINQH